MASAESIPPSPRRTPAAPAPPPPRESTLAVVKSLFLSTINGFFEDKVPRLAASLAYYTLFSLAPLLVLVIAIAGFVFGEQAARGEIVGQIRFLTGDQGAEAVQAILANAHAPETGTLAAVLGIATLLVGATGAFAELQDALNTIWGVMAKPGHTLTGILRVRLTSFLMILGTGFLLLVSLVLSAALNALATFVRARLPLPADVMEGIDVVLTLALFTLLLAMIYKILPDVEINWSDVWIGALLTSTLLSAGKYLIGLYLGRSSIASTYGAAGSVVIVLLWVYYSATILFLGAEFTQCFAVKFGCGIYPSKHAIRVSDVVSVQARRDHDDSEVQAAVKREARRTVETAVRQVDRTTDVSDPDDPAAT